MRRNRFDGGGDTKDTNMGNNSPSKLKKDTNMGENSPSKLKKDTFSSPIKSNSKEKEIRRKFVNVDYDDYMVNGVLNETAYGNAIAKANPHLYPKSKNQKISEKIVKEVKKNKSK